MALLKPKYVGVLIQYRLQGIFSGYSVFIGAIYYSQNGMYVSHYRTLDELYAFLAVVASGKTDTTDYRHLMQITKILEILPKK
jgi:hypothetical protein